MYKSEEFYEQFENLELRLAESFVDVQIEERYGVKYTRYFFEDGSIFVKSDSGYIGCEHPDI